MDYIAIKNKGLIVVEDLMLIGSSTKRNDNTKIGMFGSGWKYALAWLLRNKCTIKVYSGKEEITIGTRFIYHRNMETYIITVNGQDTSLTTEMGPQWSGWMAIREIISNAIDEGDFAYEVDSSITPEEDTTVIYIELNNELRDVMEDFDFYFAFNRANGVKCNISTIEYTFYVKSALTPIAIYRKGIRCSNMNDKSLFDVSFSDININESRLADDYPIKERIASAMLAPDLTKEVFKAVFLSTELDIENRLKHNSVTNTIRNIVRELVIEGVEFTASSYRTLLGHIATGSSIVLPAGWYHDLVNEGILVDKLKHLFVQGDPEGFLRDNNVKFDLKGLTLILKQFGFNIITGKFADTNENIRVSESNVFISNELNYAIDALAGKILYRASSYELELAIRNTKAYKQYTLSIESLN